MWHLWPCNRLLLEPRAWNIMHCAGHLKWGREADVQNPHSGSQRRVTCSQSGFVRAESGEWSGHVPSVSVPCKIRITTLAPHPRVFLKPQNWEISRQPDARWSAPPPMHLLMCAWHRLRQIQCSDHSCLIEHSFYENYPVFNHARKLGETLQAERLRETKRWSMPLRLRLCCLGVVVSLLGWWLLSMKLISSFWSSLSGLPDLADLYTGHQCSVLQ